MPFPEIDPVAFAIGPLVVRWYALAYLAGIALGWLYGRYLMCRPDLWGGTAPFTRAQWIDFPFWAVLGIVAGGRIGYVAFYNLPYFLGNPLDALAIWQGGMSFHGGLIGICLAMAWFARRHGAAILTGFDLLACISTFGLFFGRLANFINGELFGRITDVPWGMVFPAGGPLPRHPSQLYEAALEGVLLFALIAFVTHRFGTLRRPGLTAGIFGLGYAFSRILVETVREPDLHIGYLPGGLTMGMILSVPIIAWAGWLIWNAMRQPARG